MKVITSVIHRTLSSVRPPFPIPTSGAATPNHSNPILLRLPMYNVCNIYIHKHLQQKLELWFYCHPFTISILLSFPLTYIHSYSSMYSYIQVSIFPSSSLHLLPFWLILLLRGIKKEEEKLGSNTYHPCILILISYSCERVLYQGL